MRTQKLWNCENTVFDGKGISTKKYVIDLKEDLHNTERCQPGQQELIRC
jgi:hypothetical protein